MNPLLHRTFALLVAGVAGMACSSVDFDKVPDDYGARFGQKLYRLHVVTAPAPAGDARIGEMWSMMAKRYVNHHRDFIAKQTSTAAALDASACGEGIEGVLHLSGQLSRTGGGAKVRVVGRLLACQSGAIVWEARVSDTWDADDDNVTQLRAQYAREFGAHVEPYVAPSFHALRELLDTLPRPKLVKDVDIDEKIEVGQ
jgi:probable lipoprotein (TIGR04455 family)